MTPPERLFVLNDADKFLSIRFNYHKNNRISKAHRKDFLEDEMELSDTDVLISKNSCFNYS